MLSTVIEGKRENGGSIESSSIHDDVRSTTASNKGDCINNSICPFYGVVFGRSIRMSFCSIHVARISSIEGYKYKPPQPTSASASIVSNRHTDYSNNYQDSSSDDDESDDTDNDEQGVTLIRIQFATSSNPIELRSYFRRFVKNGDLLSVPVTKQDDKAETNSSNSTRNSSIFWQQSPREEIASTDSNSVWNAPRLIVNVATIEQAMALVQIERRNFWSMRQYQEWQRLYLISSTATTTTISPTCARPTTLTANSNSDTSDKSLPSHHDSGIDKRTQGGYVTNFLLHLITRKIFNGEEFNSTLPSFLSDPTRWAQQDLRSHLSPHHFQQVVTVLNQGLGVLDVAGGSGHVSMALSLHGIKATVVDPREKAGKLPKRDRKQYHKKMKQQLQGRITTDEGENPPLPYCQPIAEKFETIRAWFGVPPDGIDTSYRHPDKSTISVLDENQIKKGSAIVALHPDEATDAIVDMAVRLKIPFVIVPCCVFNRLFPHRRMPNTPDVPVNTYHNLLDYLQYKDPSIGRAILPFVGSNTVLFSHF